MLPPDSTDTSRPNPRIASRKRRHRRFYGLSDEEQREVFKRQRDAIIDIFKSMEDYFCAELDAKLVALERRLMDEPKEIDAEFAEEEGN